MKCFLRITALILTIVFFVTALTYCTDGKSIDDKNNGDVTKTNYIDISNYVIVRPDMANVYLIKAVSEFKKDILAYTGKDIKVVTDSEEPSTYEIVIGSTNRSDSQNAINTLKGKTSKEAFIIEIKNEKILIGGLSDVDTFSAMKYFINEFAKLSNKNGSLLLREQNGVLIKKTGDHIYTTDDFHTVILEDTLTVAKPEDILDEEEFAYPKVIKLENQENEKDNGTLLVVNENTKGEKWAIYRSVDDGKTWETLNRIPDNINTKLKKGYQAYIYELPADVGEYKKGTILFAGCSYGNTDTKIYLAASRDLGTTWESVCNVDEGGGFNQNRWLSEGLWEPVLIYENGRLYCMYSDERDNGAGNNHVGGHNQKLVYRYTTDLKTWSDVGEMMASDTPNLRPGMISITKMGNGKWALVYEMDVESGLQIHIKFADSLDSWDVADNGKPVKTIQGNGIGSAPTIVWTPAGGECGTLFVVAQRNTKKSTSETKCDLFMSFDYGETFVSVKNPIPVTENEHVRCGRSAGFYVDKQGTVYYVNNPLWKSNSFGAVLSLVKIKVY